MAPVEAESVAVKEENNGSVNDLTETDEKIANQIEYYFGDINVRRDKFLKEKMAEDPEGWVPIEVLLTFNRLKSLTTDPKVICAAINKAASDVVEVNAEETKIRRLHPVSNLTEEQLHQLHLRTVHFKGFPLDATLDSIKKFATQYGKVEAVEMRKTRLEKTFKGCCMVVYSTLAEAEKAVEGKEIFTDAIPKFLRENKIDYFKRKAEYRRERMANRKKAKYGGKQNKNGEANKDEVKTEDNAAGGDGKVTDMDADAKATPVKNEAAADGVKTEAVDGAGEPTGDKEADEKADGDNSRKRKHEGGNRGRGGHRGKRFKGRRRGGGYKGNRNKGKA